MNSMERHYTIEVEGREYVVSAHRDGQQIVVEHDGVRYVVAPVTRWRDAAMDRPSAPSAPHAPSSPNPSPAPRASVTPDRASVPETHGVVNAPMAGVIKKLLVEVGAQVEQGQGVVVMEAMKMEVDISTSVAGTVATILVQSGASVAAHQPLMRIE